MQIIGLKINCYISKILYRNLSDDIRKYVLQWHSRFIVLNYNTYIPTFHTIKLVFIYLNVFLLKFVTPFTRSFCLNIQLLILLNKLQTVKHPPIIYSEESEVAGFFVFSH